MVHGGEREVSVGRKMTRERGGGADGGAAVRRWRLEDGGIAMTAENNRGKEWRQSSRRHGGVRQRQQRRLDSFPGLP